MCIRDRHYVHPDSCARLHFRAALLRVLSIYDAQSTAVRQYRAFSALRRRSGRTFVRNHIGATARNAEHPAAFGNGLTAVLHRLYDFREAPKIKANSLLGDDKSVVSRKVFQQFFPTEILK